MLLICRGISSGRRPVIPLWCGSHRLHYWATIGSETQNGRPRGRVTGRSAVRPIDCPGRRSLGLFLSTPKDRRRQTAGSSTTRGTPYSHVMTGQAISLMGRGALLHRLVRESKRSIRRDARMLLEVVGLLVCSNSAQTRGGRAIPFVTDSPTMRGRTIRVRR